MSADFNVLVADVARANVRCERAASLVIEAECAYNDAAAELAAAEAELNRAIAAECTSPAPRRARTEAPPPARLVSLTLDRAAFLERTPATPVLQRRCGGCRRVGHRIQRCPDLVVAKG